LVGGGRRPREERERAEERGFWNQPEGERTFAALWEWRRSL
jgi:hypothetical protein